MSLLFMLLFFFILLLFHLNHCNNLTNLLFQRINFMEVRFNVNTSEVLCQHFLLRFLLYIFKYEKLAPL